MEGSSNEWQCDNTPSSDTSTSAKSVRTFSIANSISVHTCDANQAGRQAGRQLVSLRSAKVPHTAVTDAFVK